MYDTTSEPYTQATTRLDYDALNYDAPIAPPAPHRHDLGFALIGVGVLLFFLMSLARLPQPPVEPVYPVDQHVEIFSRNCIGWCPQ